MSELRGGNERRYALLRALWGDIHIVPDFEPEIEYNMEQTLHDIAREMTPEEDATDDQDAQQSMTELQDWDEEPLEIRQNIPFAGNSLC